MNKQAIAVILLSIGLSACGQKGPLTHPQAAPESAPEQVTPSE
ncbi:MULTISPECIES: LPS translocon maturation chaperone LptM [unclassified Agarivorans]|nr:MULTISPECIES: lipoprotein [unclassified Agarivorans]MDO6685657.1 lipoprotein [Agarivorans sp. 3_MG-2023]MDO6716228.1 lipoprotein [Agarivorans sp. 2_MG-2023]MDO6764395.1 lipoprotein [Agarivorans sp. 1_MG-2023]